MYINYNKFINENNIEGITQKEIDFLKEYKITEYKFNTETNLIDIYQDVDFRNKKLYYLPIRMGIVYGELALFDNNLTTLKGMPYKVTGTFSVTKNKLTSLEYCPKEIGHDFYCGNNLITSLKGCPEKINRDFYCNDNLLSSLEYCPKEITIDFYCYRNKNLTSLEHCPKYVGGDFKFYNDYFEIKYSNDRDTLIEDYPLCIIKDNFTGREDIYSFLRMVLVVVKQNEELFIPLLDNKIKFHQMVMRLNPGLIQYYKTIPPPSKNSKLLL